MNYNLTPIKYFVDIVETGGFSSAAKKNFVSETAVSVAIRKLEKELGYKLIDRNKGSLTLPPTGARFYKQAVALLLGYESLWQKTAERTPAQLRIHYLAGMAGAASRFANLLGQTYPHRFQTSFNQEILGPSINHLLSGEFDLLVGFAAAFRDNPKIVYRPMEPVSFQLVFNKDELAAERKGKELAARSTFYLQYWHSPSMDPIQQYMLGKYQQAGWTYAKLAGVNSFSGALLNVNFSGGFTMVPTTTTLPAGCDRLCSLHPAHLKEAFSLGLAVSKNNHSLIRIVDRVLSAPQKRPD